MRKSKRLLAFTLAALQILMLLPSTGMSAYAEEPEAVSESVESDEADEPSGVLPSDPVEGTGDSSEPVEDAGATLEPSGVPSVDPVEGTEDSLEPVEDAGAIENEGQAEVLPAESTEGTGDPAKPVESTEPSEVLPSEPVKDAEVIESEGQAGVLPSDEPDVFYTLKVVDTYADTQVSDIRYEESLPAGQGYSFSALEADGYVVGGDAEYQGELTEDTTLEFVYDREYTVTFYDMIMEEVITKVKVKSGEAAEAPEAPVYEGFEFIGWSEEFNSVSSDLTVETLYQASGVSLMSAGTELSNDYASAILYEDEKRLVVTGMFKNGTKAAAFPWYGKVSGYSIEFTNDVTFIGNYAFSGSGMAGELAIPDSVTSIGNDAFSGCSNITGNLVIPNSVTSIGGYAFSGCLGFTGDLVISDSVTSIGNDVFRGCSGFTGDLVIPDSVTSIGTRAFRGCTGFNGTLTLGNSVTSIGNNAFYECSSLTGDLVIPNSVTSIKYYAFSGCIGFNGTLTLGDSVTSIEYNAFQNCTGLTGDLVIPDSVISIGNYAFQNCKGFGGTLTLGNSVTSIGNGAFYECSSLTGDLVIPDSVTSVGGDAFRNCKSFGVTLTLGNSVTSIGYGAFRECLGLTGDLVIPDSVTSIGNDAFRGCTGFNGTLTLGNSVTSIGNNAFYECSSLTGDLVIPDSVTSIGNGAFQGCSGFGFTLTFGDSVISIGEWAFCNCKGLTGDLVLPNSVTSIGRGAFHDCSGLTGDLVIPDSVTSIGARAFSNCSNFSDTLIIGKSVTSIGEYAFSSCQGISIIRDESLATTSFLKYKYGIFSVNPEVDTKIYSDKPFMLNYNWRGDKRVVTFASPEYEVSFNTQGGTSVASQYVASGGYAVKPANPKRSGYKLLGWKTSNDAEEYFDFEATPITKSMTLYAQWEEKSTFTVTFDTNGGTSVDPQEVEPNGKVTEPADPVKDGFAFEYWYRDADGASVPFDFESTVITEDMTLCALWIENSKFVVTVIDEYYDVDGTTLLSSETRLSEELSKDSSYNYEALSTVGYKVLGQSSYTGTVTEDLTVTFKYAEDVSVLGGTLVLSIPAEMKLAYDPELGDYIKTDSVYASGRCGMKKRLDVQTPQHITFVNNDDDSVVIENAKVTFGSAVSDGSMQEQWSATELREGIGSPVGKSISVAVDKAAIDYLGSYSSLITYNVSLVENLKD